MLLLAISSSELKAFEKALKDALENKKESVFTQRTDAASAEQYFQVGRIIFHKFLYFCDI